MPRPVVTVASGGLAVVDVTASKPLLGLPVREASNGFGLAVTKVTSPKPGLAVTYYTDPIIDFTKPVITSTNFLFINENTPLALALTANETVTWSLVAGELGTVDNAKLEIVGSTLRFLGNVTKDYEIPDDFDANHTYVCYVRATDTSGNYTDLMVSIGILNVADPT